MITGVNPQGSYADGTGVGNGQYAGEAPSRRLSTETKASFKTTEFFAYLAAVVGVLIARSW